MFPVIFVFERMIDFISGLFGDSANQLTEDEIRALVSIGKEEGVIEDNESEMISNVLDFNDLRVLQIMTPRKKIISLGVDVKLDDAINCFIDNGVSRIPVYKDSVDNIIGVITLMDILILKKHKKNKYLGDFKMNLPIFTPETKFVDDLFTEFKVKSQHIALVVNEHGSITGLITMEDILEELVGDISDESDKDELMFKKLSSNSWYFNADIEIEELNSILHTKFSCDEHKTLSYMVLNNMQKIPKKGDDFKINSFHFYVDKVEKNKICYIRAVRINDSLEIID